MIDPFWILLVGVVVVVGGVLWLKLHAFLALILGALIVASMTQPGAIERYEIEDSAGKIVRVVEAEGEPTRVVVAPARQQSLEAGSVLLAFPSKATDLKNEPLAKLQVEPQEPGEPLTATVVSGSESVLRPGDLVIEPTALKAAGRRAEMTVGQRVAAEFGRTCAGIGILVAMAAIIGDCLLASGGADRIVRSTLRLVGERRAPLAFLSSGYVLGIPVFFDTVFYLLIPLGKAMHLRTGKNYILYVLTMIAGATMTHSLVPPTPGPLAVANELQIDLGLMILGGSIVGAFTAAFGYLYALWVNSRHVLPLRESIDMPLAEMEKLAQRPESELPPFWLSIAPILLPVVLIAGKTICESVFRGVPVSEMSVWELQVQAGFAFFGDQNLAMVLAAAVALGMLAWRTRASREDLARTIGLALASGAIIILITAAGGAFGGVLRETGIGSRIKEAALEYQISGIGILLLAFLVTTLIRTAQGSSTVAMITAAGILGDTFAPADLGFHPVYLALAIGCGSKPISWMNDSGFWVICKLSGMTERETLRYLTPMTAAMGVIGVIVTMIGAKFWPLVTVASGS